ncbi:MAG: molybdopterin oxidoreductase family protein [Proteobacteria bacterium]|nr:molybdopterin oxidoreductase family protein [Pseudomonadota bacterium]
MAEPDEIVTHYRSCNLCEAICGLEIKLVDRQVISIKGDKQDPFSRGHICPKAVALADIQNDPNRLHQPQLRVSGKWQTIGWQDAFELVAQRLTEIRKLHGNDAIAIYQGNPNSHNYGLLTHAAGFPGLLRTRNRFSASSVDQSPHQLVAYWMYGHQLLLPIPDIDHCDYFLVIGANPMVSNGSLMTVPDLAKRLGALRQRGGKLVVIDPRRSETADVADAHHFIRPGSDALFLFALLQVIFAENLARPGRLEPMLSGLAELRAALQGFAPEAVAAATGIHAESIRRIAREFAGAPRAVCYGRMGVSTQVFGSLCQWAIQLLNIVTGNLDRPGGALVTDPAVDVVAALKSRPGSYGRWSSRVSGRPEVNGELPVAVLAEEILKEGEGQVRALITIAGNPVLSTPNGRQLDQALAQLEFMVAIDFYINETTRHADLILPPTAPLEHDQYDLVFNLLAVRNIAKYSPPTLPKPDDGLHDWEILQGLGQRLAAQLGVPARLGMSPERLIDLGLRTGPYGRHNAQRLSLARLRAAPHGIDLGALSSSFPQRLATADKKIHCAPQLLLADLQRVQALLQQPPPPDQLLLIGRRHSRSNNSWMHNYQRLVKGQLRCTLLVHPDDLASRGLVDGESAKLASRVGCLTVQLEADAAMMPGTVSLPHGWGHDRDGIQLDIASAHAGVSANDLTDDRLLDRLSGNAALNGVPVSLTR